MVSVCLRKFHLTKAAGVLSGLGVSLALATSAFAQVSSTGSSSLPKGGTSSSLPPAGSTEITYVIFGAGVLLFVFGMMKLVRSFQD